MQQEQFTAFAYLDVDDPIVAWAVYRGALVSAQALTGREDGNSFPVSIMLARMLLHQDNRRLHNELLIDAIRSQRHAHCVSRLTGVYFFTTREHAQAAESWGAHFRTENLAEVIVGATLPVTRVDANWITFARPRADGRLDGSNLSWIDRYWSGEAHGATPVWEVIVHGRAIVLGTDLRERAYRVLAERFPHALDALEVSRLAAAVDNDLFQTLALMRQVADARYRIDYCLDVRSAGDRELIDRLAQYGGPKNIRDLQPGKETFGVPDLRPVSCEFTVSQRFGSISTSNSLVPAVHRID